MKRLKSVSTLQAAALAVVINSPGGLPVQSQIISDKLRDYASKHNLKLYTFARDVAASGGYLILCGGDHVVADSSSIVGSIGVVFQRLKLRGLLDQFKVDHKQFATNEYSQRHSANFSTQSSPPTRNSLPNTRSIWNKSARTHMPSSSPRSRSSAGTDSRPTTSPFQEKSSTARKPCSRASLTRWGR